MSSQLIWQLINKHNSFKRKGRAGNRAIFSAEPGNLYNKHSYKYSGLADSKVIDIQPGEGNSVVITASRSKNKNKPANSRNTYTSKRNARKAATSIGKVTKGVRPDLQKAAQARISAITKSHRVQKAAAKSK